MDVDEAELSRLLDAVTEPDLGLPLGELSMVREVRERRGRVSVVVALPVEDWPGVDLLEVAVRDALGALGGLRDLKLTFVEMTPAERSSLIERLAPGRGGAKPNRLAERRSRTRVVGVSSGKGGVGKSSVTVNLAVALAAAGKKVGLLDADVYGFSVPKMLGVERAPAVIDDLVIPPVAHGVRCLSMGFFVPDDQPVIWRGPMLHKALEQFVVDAYWGEPDFLLVDMPPGTGDVALSLGQHLPTSEILVVTTPQPAAQRVAQRSAYAARKLDLPVRGVIENMSWFTGGDGIRYELFGAGGGAQLAEALGVPLLAQVPLVPAVREGADVGVPVRVSDPSSEASQVFDALGERLVALGPARVYRSELTLR